MINQPDNPYQNALLTRLNGPGYQAPVDPTTAIDPPKPTGGSLQDILGRYQYGAKGLADAEGELTAAGYQLQKDSGGRVRGRLKGPTGDIIDVIGQGEGNDWWNNQTGSAWNINNRGQEGLDAGGWSFGGANSIGGPSMPIPMSPMESPFPGIPNEHVQSVGMDPGNERSPFLKALLQQLGGAL